MCRIVQISRCMGPVHTRKVGPIIFELGSYHTLELAKDRQFEIEKEEWDAMHIERIETAADPSRDADVAAVVMQSVQFCKSASTFLVIFH